MAETLMLVTNETIFKKELWRQTMHRIRYKNPGAA